MLEQLKKGTFSIHSVFEHTMNAIYEDRLITFGGADFPEGINNIVTNISTFSTLFEQGNIIAIDRYIITVNDTLIMVPSTSIKEYNVYTDTYDINNTHIENAHKLIEFIEHEEVLSVFRYDKTNTSQRYQFYKIATFLNTPNLETAKQIVGLGMGLTPIGDDVLTGYLFARQALGNSVSWMDDIVEYAQNRTNNISLKSLIEVKNYQYTSFLINVLESFFEQNSLEITKKWINFGATSGAALLTGFTQGILEEEQSYETTQSI